MRRIQALTLCILLTALCWLSTGCQFMPHRMQPSQLWKMNRQDAWDEGGYFSIRDPEDARLAGAGDQRADDGGRSAPAMYSARSAGCR